MKISSSTSTPIQTSSYSRSYSWLRGMNYIGKMAQGVKSFYNEMNPATLTGAIDVVVVKQPDGTFRSSPFHVRFGKMALIKTKDLTVDIEINGKPVELHMRLGDAGEAYFVTGGDGLELSSSSSCESLQDDVESEFNNNNNRTASYDVDFRRDTLVNDDSSSAATTSVKFFSDGDITPEVMSRPMSPKSDSETINVN